MISLKQLEAFLASAKWGSFVAAAARLNTTQSNISKRIQELEGAVGKPLFERGARSLTLTVKGRQLIPQAEEVLGAYRRFAEIAAPGSNFHGPFSIGSVSVIAMSWLSLFIHRVREQHPGIDLSSHVDLKPSMTSQLMSGAIDLVFASGAFEPPELETELLVSTELVWVCHPSLAPSAGPVTLEDIAKSPLVEHTSSQNGIRRLFSDRGLRPNIVATCSDFQARARFAVAGMGVTHIPRYVVEGELATGRLVIIECETPLPPIQYYAAYRRGDGSHLPAALARIAAKCCDFGMFPQVVGGPSINLGVGRSDRLIGSL